MKSFFYWSGGKDSALALYRMRQQGLPVEALVTTVNSGTGRTAMHGVRRELVEQQAAAIGLPLYTVELPEMPGMQAYEDAVQRMHQQLRQQGYTHAVFGDIFLEDLKAYRETLLAKDDLRCLFPLWGMESKDVLADFWDAGFSAVAVCTDASKLSETFCGRLLDNNFIADLPPGVDRCGENGEYHSFVFDGPLFSSPVKFKKGKVVFKEYKAPQQDDCFATPQARAGFYFQDLAPLLNQAPAVFAPGQTNGSLSGTPGTLPAMTDAR